MRKLLLIVIALICLPKVAPCAAPMGHGNRDLVLCSSLGFDRSPCSLEWWQYRPDWKWGDYRYLRMTNETWTDVAVGKLFGMSRRYLLATVDNSMGYSAVPYWHMDEYGGLKNQGLLLRNEPWRQYEGVTVCDLDKDGVAEIVTVAKNRKGQRGIISFKTHTKYLPPREKMLLELKSRACGLASMPSSSKTTDLFIAYPGDKKTGGRIMRIRIAANGKIVSKVPSFVTVPATLGEIGGVSVQLSSDRKKVRMVVATHDWGKDEGEKVTSASSFKTDTGFILPSWNIELVQSYLYKTEYASGAKPGKLEKVDSLKARRWTGVAFCPVSAKPTQPIKGKKYEGGRGILQLCGLFHNSYDVETLAAKFKMKLTRHYVKQFQQKCSIPDFDFKDLEKYDAVFLTNVPLWALGSRGVRAIQAYVNGGGTLVFCDGLFAGKVGGYAGSPIEKILPVKIKADGFAVVSPKKVSVKSKFYNLPTQGKFYYLRQRTCKPKARPVAWVGDEVLVAKWQVEKGTVVYVGCVPLADNKDRKFAAWTSINWGSLLSSLKMKRIEE